MAAPAEDEEWFGASNDLLVDRYLRAKLDGRLGDLARAAYFLDADVCSARPWDLVRAHSKPARVQLRDAGDGKQFYFFSPVRFVGTKKKKKRARTIAGTGDKESWHAEGSSKPVEGSAAGGYITKFSYHVRIESKIVEKPGWIMTEYSLGDIKEGDLVLCKIYKSPRGPGRSVDSSSSPKLGCKRKAADDIEGAAPSTRPRQTNEEEDDDVMQFVGDIEHELMSVEQHAAAPEFEQLQQNMVERQPEPQFVAASTDSSITIEQLQHMMMAEETDDGTRLQVPDGEDPDAYYMRVLFGDEHEQQDAAVQIVPASFDGDAMLDEHLQNWSMPQVDRFEAFDEEDWGSLFDGIPTTNGLLTDGGVIAALATGVTVDELFHNGPSTSCLHPGGIPCT